MTKEKILIIYAEANKTNQFYSDKFWAALEEICIKKKGEKGTVNPPCKHSFCFLYSDPTCISVHPAHKIFVKARKYPSRGLY